MGIVSKYLTDNTTPSREQLKELISVKPWFEGAKALLTHLDGSSTAYTIDAEKIAEVTEGEIIERFLRKGEYRIVAEEGEVEQDICTEACIDDEDDIVSEELAEIYVAQGLKSQAIEIYRKLSLLNTEKFAYFAEKISELENNN
jgi:hypothetical protein